MTNTKASSVTPQTTCHFDRGSLAMMALAFALGLGLTPVLGIPWNGMVGSGIYAAGMYAIHRKRVDIFLASLIYVTMMAGMAYYTKVLIWG